MYHYGNQQKGIVFIAILFFMQMTVVIGLYLIQSALLSERQSRHLWSATLFSLAAEQRLKMIESVEDIEEASCVIPVLSKEDLLNQSIEWWESLACHENRNQHDYYYVIEILNNDCISLDESRNVSKPIKIIRISLLAYNKNKSMREFLQSTVIKLDNADRDCVVGLTGLKLGRQSWRRF